MSQWQPSLASGEQPSVRSGDTGSPLALGLVAGMALLALGAALFGLGIFHGFENGSCSTTGYSAHYGPVQHCGKGVGWWMLMLMAGLVVAGGGAALSRPLNLTIPVLFIAIGAPFIALALRGGNAQLLHGTSPGTGRLFAGIFGACFVIGGGVWGLTAGSGAVSRIGGRSQGAGLLSALIGVGLAFAIAAGVAGAIGPSAPTALGQVGQGVGQSAGPSGPSSAAAAQSHAAITQATAQADKAAKLAACVTAAGIDTAKVQACVARYTP
jgi:hypothetical protein